MGARRHILSTIHTRSTDSLVRRIISRTRTIAGVISELAPTFLDNCAANLRGRRVLRDTAAGGCEVSLYVHLTSVFVSLSFFPRASRPPFLCFRAVYGSR